MSPSWRERWLVSLTPARVGVLRLGAGLRPKLQGQAVHACEPEPGAAWAAPVRALARLLEQAPARPLSLLVVVSNHFARYAIVPWTEGVHRDSERLAVAHAHFHTVFGPDASAWAIAAGEPEYGRATLAAAIDADLLTALRSLVSRRRAAVLASVRPHLSAALDAFHRALGGDNALALVEPGRLSIAFRRRDQWSEVVNRRVPTDRPGELAEALRQCLEVEAVAGGVGSLAVLAPGIELPELRAGKRTVTRLRSEDRDSWVSMARMAQA